jgi:hypothetical protein
VNDREFARRYDARRGMRKPAPRRRRSSATVRLRTLLAAIALLPLAAACDQYRASAEPPTGTSTSTPQLTPGTEGIAEALSSVCRVDAVDPAIAVETLQGPEGACVPPATVVAMRCDPSLDPIAVVEAGSGDGRTYLGGAFAVPIRALPSGVSFLGVGPSGRFGEPTSFPRALYQEAGSVTARWLALARPNQVSANPSVLLIGDSILDGAADAVTEGLPGWEITIDAVVGRSSSGGIAVVEGAVTAPDVVVLELGTNDVDADAFRANAERILAAPAVVDADLVVWLTARNPDGITPAVNRAIFELMGSVPHGTVADWDRFVPPEALNGDGVHLASGQEPVFAGFVAEALETWRAAVHERGPSRCTREVLAAAGLG